MICIQKGEVNPITGILLDVSELPVAVNHNQVDSNNHEPLSNFAAFLDQHQNLSLYVYDRRQEEHVVRNIENQRATQILSRLNNQADVNAVFSVEEVRSLPSYNQYNSISDSVDKSFNGLRLKAARQLSDQNNRGGCITS